MPGSDKILQLLRVLQTNVYVVGCFGSRLTFSSQQCRAFNLVWALFDSRCLKAGDRLAVIGAGLAGITAAAAATALGVKVTVFEQASQSMALQRGNFVRYIHPNILDWPKSHSHRTKTKWDILNWEAAPLDTVVSQIDHGWSNFENAVTMHFRYRVDKVDVGAGRVQASAQEPQLMSIDETFNVIIIAVGFGMERTLETVPLRSYWLNDDLHQESRSGANPRRVLVTGCGDGGLIDVLRLRLTNFDHERFVKDILDDEELRAVRKQLLIIERKARKYPTIETANDYLVSAYGELPFHDSVFERFRGWQRLDTDVVLNGPQQTPVTIQASILHRYIIFLLWSRKLLTYKRGKVVHISGNRGNYAVSFENPDGSNVMSSFEEVIVRHGPEPVIQQLIPESAVQKLCNLWRAETTDSTVRQHWPRGYFRRERSASKSLDNEVRAKTLLNKALAALRPVHVGSIRVEMVGDRIGYVVVQTITDPKQERPKSIFGIPLQYRVEKVLPRPEEAKPPAVLRPGAMVYRGNSRESSTLGCFVITKEREVGFLTTSHGLVGSVPPMESVIGSNVYQTTDWGAHDSANSVAQVKAFIAPMSTPQNSELRTPVLNSFDIAVCTLLPNVPYKTAFDEVLGLPPLVGTAWPRRGDRVFKVGGRSGLTYGTIVSVSGIVMVSARRNPLWLQNAITIEPEGTSMFSNAGDSGALVMRETDSGALILGMLVGSDNRRLSSALPLQPALEAMDCSFILQNTFQQSWKRLC